MESRHLCLSGLAAGILSLVLWAALLTVLLHLMDRRGGGHLIEGLGHVLYLSSYFKDRHIIHGWDPTQCHVPNARHLTTGIQLQKVSIHIVVSAGDEGRKVAAAFKG